MDITQIIGLVDGFMTLGILLYFTHQHRKDITELKKESLNAQDKHIADLKTSKDEYAGLLEKTLLALNSNQDFIRDHIVGLEDRLKSHFNDAIKEQRNVNRDK